MALNWKTVTADHIRAACQKVAASGAKRVSRIVIYYGGQTLPAKEVQRTAYLIAHQLPDNTELKFSSGDSTLNLLNGLGFKAERLAPPPSGQKTAP